MTLGSSAVLAGVFSPVSLQAWLAECLLLATALLLAGSLGRVLDLLHHANLPPVPRLLLFALPPVAQLCLGLQRLQMGRAASAPTPTLPSLLLLSSLLLTTLFLSSSKE